MREDQREERDAVEGEAVEVEDQQGQGERRGDGDRRRCRDSRQPSVSRISSDTPTTAMPMWKQQFVRFLRGGLAVVAGDGDLDVGGDDRALQRVDLAPAPRRPRRWRWRRGAWRRVRVTAGCSSAVRRPVGPAPCVRTKHVLRCVLPRRRRRSRPRRAGRPACPPKTPTTTLPTSSALCRNAPVSIDDLAVVGGQAAGAELAVGLLQHRARCRPGSGCARRASTGSSSTRTCRRAPPMSVVSATSGTCLTASSTCAASRRSVRWS